MYSRTRNFWQGPQSSEKEIVTLTNKQIDKIQPFGSFTSRFAESLANAEKKKRSLRNELAYTAQ